MMFKTLRFRWHSSRIAHWFYWFFQDLLSNWGLISTWWFTLPQFLCFIHFLNVYWIRYYYHIKIAFKWSWNYNSQTQKSIVIFYVSWKELSKKNWSLEFFTVSLTLLKNIEFFEHNEKMSNFSIWILKSSDYGCGICGVLMPMFVVHFIFRYFAMQRKGNLKYFEGWYFLYWLSVPLISGFLWAQTLFAFLYEDTESSDYMRLLKLLFQNLFIIFSEKYYLKIMV